MRVDVYRNLNKPDVTYSVRHKGKVIDYRRSVVLANVTAKHATAKQLHAVRNLKRQVCQWLKGSLLDDDDLDDGVRDCLRTREWRRLACNPKTHDGICDSETGERVHTARYVLLDESGAYYVT